ncbi:MAG TPA: MbcA/ParS/Xre antitoxin family protein [Opitutaceae bacterium]|nr:MbcA/ParS/Xre antitoxin family protein [Opitutaceae bacterium]
MITVSHRGNIRTKVLAYTSATNPVLKAIGDANVEVVHLFDLEHAGVSLAEGAVFLIDQPLDDAEKAAISGLVMNEESLVIGPTAADGFTWRLKAEANAHGRIFEVAESNSSFEKLVESTLRAVHGRSFHRINTKNHDEQESLDSLPGIASATSFLRSERGRLDAEKVRALFTLTRAELSRVTGIQEETMRQTPDSDRLQTPLRPFERTAQLLSLNRDPANFAKWLHTPNEELDGHTPLELIKTGRIEVLATLVHDILLNRGR